VTASDSMITIYHQSLITDHWSLIWYMVWIINKL